MRKRIFATIMAFIICLSLTACDSSALENGNYFAGNILGWKLLQV